MKYILYTLFSLLLLLCFINLSYSLHCKKIDSCSCKWDNGTVTSLHSFGSKNGIRFKNMKGVTGSNVRYFYNPCYSFSLGPNCSDSAVCSAGSNEPTVSYGAQSSATFETIKGNSLVLSYSVGNQARLANLYIICTPTPLSTPFQVTGVLPTDPPSLLMSLADPSVCARKPTPGGGSGGSSGSNKALSIGSIICIVFASLVASYIVLGVVVSKFVLKREGKEIFPNYSFWTSLPGYSKDGGKFVVNKIKGKNTSYSEAN